MDFFFSLSRFCGIIRFSHIIRRLIEKLGPENANDLIVDESIDGFDDTHTTQMPQNYPTFYEPPSTLHQPAHDSFSHGQGYSYPIPNEANRQIHLKPATDFNAQTPNVADAIVHTNDGAVHYAVNAPSGLPYTINQR